MILAPAASALAADNAPRISDPALTRTTKSFLHDAATMTYWHYMSILCPFEKRDVEDLDLFLMVMAMPDDAPRLTTQQQAKLDRYADALTRRVLAGDRAAACRSAAEDMQADFKTFAEHAKR